jgi:hypothetical protein
MSVPGHTKLERLYLEYCPRISSANIPLHHGAVLSFHESSSPYRHRTSLEQASQQANTVFLPSSGVGKI